MDLKKLEPAKLLRDWQKGLDPQTVLSTLSRAGLFLSGYELLRDAIVDRARGFFMTGLKDGDLIIAPEYSVRVRSLDQDELRASAKWCNQLGALDSRQMDQLARLRETRNQIAHELPELLFDSGKDIALADIELLYKLVDHLDRWWAINVEIPTNPDFDSTEVSEKDVVSLRSIWLAHLINVVSSGGKPPRQL